jgi:hypothetical protein
VSQHDPYGPDGPLWSPAPPPYPQGYQPQQDHTGEEPYELAGSPQPGYQQPGYQQPGYQQPGYEHGQYQPASNDQQGSDHGYGQHGYDQRAYDQYYEQGTPPGHPPAGYPPAGYGYGYAPQPQRTNVMAILGLVFAFLFSPLGVLFSAIGLGQVRKRNEKGRGLAIAGLILSLVFLLIGALMLAVVAPAVKKAVDEAAAGQAGTAASAPPSDVILDPGNTGGSPGSGGVAPGDGQGVLAACKVIIPALLDLETDLQDVRTPAGFSRALAKLEQTMSTAATGTSDAQFQKDVAQLNADLEKAATAVRNGQDPSGLERVLGADGEAVGTDCGSAGFTN